MVFILKLISMKTIGEIPDCNKVVLILRWSYFQGGLIVRFYCIGNACTCNGKAVHVGIMSRYSAS